jgi:hypothetical protein
MRNPPPIEREDDLFVVRAIKARIELREERSNLCFLVSICISADLPEPNRAMAQWIRKESQGHIEDKKGRNDQE